MKKQLKSKMEVKRHSLSHLMAAAILEIRPKGQLGVGPSIENGFYHDLDLPKNLTPEDLPKIEKRMRQMIKDDVVFEKIIKPINQAIKEAKAQKLKYRTELLEELKKQGEKNVSLYQSGNFINLCKGPHVKSAKEIDSHSFKLTHLAGAYWRGDEKNKMLQRVYGVAFETKEKLEAYLKQQKEAEKRNHRKIGKEMELFAIIEEVGQGLPVWLPKGYAMRRVIEDYLLKLDRKYGYVHMLSPHIHRKEIFEKSGHLQFYKESMYAPMDIDGQKYYLKPMNCPAAMMVYKMKPKSYRELPIKMGELGTVYRYEQSGELHGLQRVRGFTQNDAHIFCTPEQLEAQFLEVFEMMTTFYKDIGFKDYYFRLSLSDPRKDKYKICGNRADWIKAEKELRNIAQKAGIKTIEAKGEAAFYGPKIDVQAVNVFGKEDSVSTIQIDFNLPERFDLTYIDKDEKEKRPFVIHRALVGSFERFFAFLIEHYAGDFPVWFAPVQAQIITIGKNHIDYGKKILALMKNEDIRVELDDSNETMAKKIRSGEIQKIPYLLIIGDREIKDNSVAVRERKKGDLGPMKVEKFIKKIKEEVEKKK